MNKLFGAAAELVTGVIGLAMFGYGIKYAVDTSDEHYYLPVNNEYAVERHTDTLGNNAINLGAWALDKPRCPAPPVFVVPPARAAKPSNGS